LIILKNTAARGTAMCDLEREGVRKGLIMARLA